MIDDAHSCWQQCCDLGPHICVCGNDCTSPATPGDVVDQAWIVHRALMALDGMLSDMEAEEPAAYHVRGQVTACLTVIDQLTTTEGVERCLKGAQP